MNNQDTRFANQYAIQWFPGHMAKTLRMMEQEIQHVDASLVLLDARIPLSHAGGKFGGENSGYKVAGGLHGVEDGVDDGDGRQAGVCLNIHGDAAAIVRDLNDVAL